MTGFRLCCGLCLLLICSFTAFAEPLDEFSSQTFIQIQQENVALQSKVRRLESQVAAMREELNTPGATQIFGGIGYIVGIFGVAGWLAARKKTGREG